MHKKKMVVLDAFLIDKNSSHAHKKDQIYSFDNGVIINGLVCLYKQTKKNIY